MWHAEYDFEKRSPYEFANSLDVNLDATFA